MTPQFEVNHVITVPVIVWDGVVSQHTGATSNAVVTYTNHVLSNIYSDQGAIVPITSLNSDKYALKKPIIVLLNLEGDEYIASFTEAELSRSGESARESIDWLKSSIVSLYDLIKDYAPTKLGPLPARQLRVLGEYLVKMPHSTG
jgi:hypothetical protein